VVGGDPANPADKLNLLRGVRRRAGCRSWNNSQQQNRGQTNKRVFGLHDALFLSL
jgi:hypothetical protein